MDMKRSEPPPPTCYQKIVLTSKIEEAYSLMKQVLNDCITVLENQEGLTSETYVLSRMLYKMNSQWRSEKTLKGLKRIYTCIKRYEELNIVQYMKQLKEHLDGCDLYIGQIYLPSQLMIVYLLRKVICFVHLMSRMCEYCQHTFVYTSQNLASGLFVPQNMVFISLVSRIWTLGRSLTLHIAKCYDTIYNLLDVFPKTQVDVKTDDLPENLQEYLQPQQELPSNSSIQITSNKTKDILKDVNEMEQHIPDEIGINHDRMKEDTTTDRNIMNDMLKRKFDVLACDDDELEDLGCQVSRQEHHISNNNTEHTKGKTKKARLNPKKVIATSKTDYIVSESMTKLSSEKANSKSNKTNVSESATRKSSKKDDKSCETPVDREDENMATFDLQIQNSNSFKKLKEVLTQMENIKGKNVHTNECRKRFKELKKEHLVLKRNGTISKQFVDEAKGELQKLIHNTSGGNVLEKSHTKIIDGCSEEDIHSIDTRKVVKFEHTDLHMMDIFKRPFKSLMNLIREQQVHRQSISKNCKREIKNCAMKIKCFRKEYLSEKNEKKKKQCIKKARANVICLLESVNE